MRHFLLSISCHWVVKSAAMDITLPISWELSQFHFFSVWALTSSLLEYLANSLCEQAMNRNSVLSLWATCWLKISIRGANWLQIADLTTYSMYSSCFNLVRGSLSAIASDLTFFCLLRCVVLFMPMVLLTRMFSSALFLFSSSFSTLHWYHICCHSSDDHYSRIASETWWHSPGPIRNSLPHYSRLSRTFSKWPSIYWWSLLRFTKFPQKPSMNLILEASSLIDCTPLVFICFFRVLFLLSALVSVASLAFFRSLLPVEL